MSQMITTAAASTTHTTTTEPASPLRLSEKMGQIDDLLDGVDETAVNIYHDHGLMVDLDDSSISSHTTAQQWRNERQHLERKAAQVEEQKRKEEEADAEEAQYQFDDNESESSIKTVTSADYHKQSRPISPSVDDPSEDEATTTDEKKGTEDDPLVSEGEVVSELAPKKTQAKKKGAAAGGKKKAKGRTTGTKKKPTKRPAEEVKEMDENEEEQKKISPSATVEVDDEITSESEVVTGKIATLAVGKKRVKVTPKELSGITAPELENDPVFGFDSITVAPALTEEKKSAEPSSKKKGKGKAKAKVKATKAPPAAPKEPVEVEVAVEPEVASILEDRGKGARAEYRVKWTGADEEESWVKKGKIPAAVLQEYLDRKKAKAEAEAKEAKEEEEKKVAVASTSMEIDSDATTQDTRSVRSSAATQDAHVSTASTTTDEHKSPTGSPVMVTDERDDSPLDIPLRGAMRHRHQRRQLTKEEKHREEATTKMTDEEDPLLGGLGLPAIAIKSTGGVVSIMTKSSRDDEDDPFAFVSTQEEPAASPKPRGRAKSQSIATKPTTTKKTTTAKRQVKSTPIEPIELTPPPTIEVEETKELEEKVDKTPPPPPPKKKATKSKSSTKHAIESAVVGVVDDESMNDIESHSTGLAHNSMMAEMAGRLDALEKESKEFQESLAGAAGGDSEVEGEEMKHDDKKEDEEEKSIEIERTPPKHKRNAKQTKSTAPAKHVTEPAADETDGDESLRDVEPSSSAPDSSVEEDRSSTPPPSKKKSSRPAPIAVTKSKSKSAAPFAASRKSATKPRAVAKEDADQIIESVTEDEDVEVDEVDESEVESPKPKPKQKSKSIPPPSAKKKSSAAPIHRHVVKRKVKSLSSMEETEHPVSKRARHRVSATAPPTKSIPKKKKRIVVALSEDDMDDDVDESLDELFARSSRNTDESDIISSDEDELGGGFEVETDVEMMDMEASQDEDEDDKAYSKKRLEIIIQFARAVKSAEKRRTKLAVANAKKQFHAKIAGQVKDCVRAGVELANEQALGYFRGLLMKKDKQLEEATNIIHSLTHTVERVVQESKQIEADAVGGMIRLQKECEKALRDQQAEFEKTHGKLIKKHFQKLMNFTFTD